MSSSYYFDLGKLQKAYPAAYRKFREYMKFRVDDPVYEAWFDANATVELAMKNAIIPILEGYLMHFFNKYDIKIGVSINKLGEWIPRVYVRDIGTYKSAMTVSYVNRNEAIVKAIDSAFSKLNMDLILKR